MAIAPRYITAAYEDTVYDFIRREEGLVRRVYSDSVGIPTLGVGYALIVEAPAGSPFRYQIRDNLAADLGITIVPNSADEILLRTLLGNLNSGNGAANRTLVSPPYLDYTSYPYPTEPPANSYPLLAFDFEVQRGILTDTQVRDLFNISIADIRAQMRIRFRSHLAKLAATDSTITDPIAATDALFVSLDRSEEMLALSSLAFTNPKLIGPKLTAALYYGDRAEAWYEIRYNSNADGGHANRRYREADLFDLHNEGPLTEADAKGAYRMFTRHQDVILGADGEEGGIPGYEDRFDPMAAGSVPIVTRMVNAYNILRQSQYTQGVDIAWNHILVGETDGQDGTADTTDYRSYLGPHAADDWLVGSDQSDLIFGESGNDILDGGLANDVLYGGQGADFLLNGGTRTQGQTGPYQDPNDRFQYTLIGAPALTLNAFSPGDLGIFLEELPDDTPALGSFVSIDAHEVLYAGALGTVDGGPRRERGRYPLPCYPVMRQRFRSCRESRNCANQTSSIRAWCPTACASLWSRVSSGASSASANAT